MRQFLFLLSFIFLPYSLQAELKILVSIAPQKYLVERIAEDKVSVSVIVPQGANPHSYEPTPKQMVAAKEGHLWFRIGESFELRLAPTLKKCKIYDQREGIDLIQFNCGCCHDLNAYDSHIWLSPRLLKIEAQQITQALCSELPEHASLFEANLARLCNDLEALDTEFKSYSFPAAVLVSHPAFGYFCRDYGLEQISIEMEGKEPTPYYLTQLLNRANTEKFKTVFLQKQYNVKGGKRVADEIGASILFVDPYAENVIENLKFIAKAFVNG